jgi:uncharacterized protein (TIGR02284 family)
MDQPTASNVTTTLNHLISIAQDGVNGIGRAIEDAQDQQLKAMLTEIHQNREHMVQELKAVVTQLGGDPNQSGTLAGAAHRAFMEVKEMVTGSRDQALIQECIRGDEHAVNEFQDALTELGPSAPGAARSIIQSCLQRIQTALQRYQQLAHSGAGAG